MSEFLDLPTIIIIAVAVLVLLRLRSVLGTRTGNERPPSTRIHNNEDKNSDDKVVILHPNEKNMQKGVKNKKQDALEAEESLEEEIEEFAKSDESLKAALKEIALADKYFTPASFMDGAKAAYEMIVTAFAKGDRKTLKSLLEKDVYESFIAAIKERERLGYNVDFTFIGLPKVEFASAKLENNMAYITIKFFAEVVSATRDSEGNLIEGNGDQITNIADSWTFARNVRSKDPNWKLVATDQLD